MLRDSTPNLKNLSDNEIMLSYKEYQAILEFDNDSKVFHGRLIGILDVVTFEGRSKTEAKNAFIDSVEDYLEFCAELGQHPEKPNKKL